jgi:hypothetical protein
MEKQNSSSYQEAPLKLATNVFLYDWPKPAD